MTPLTDPKAEEIMSRYLDRDRWEGEDPFFKGMFWPETRDVEERETFRDRHSRTDRPNLLPVSLPASLRRTDFRAAIERSPGAAPAISRLEAALDTAAFDFLDERDLFAKLRPDETITHARAHAFFLECAAPSKTDVTDRIAFVAARIEAVANEALRGVVLHCEKHMGYGDNYALEATGDGYALLPKQREVVTERTENSVTTQSQRLELPMTRSVDGFHLGRLADPARARGKAFGKGWKLDADHAACIVADMAAQGVKAAILTTEDDVEFVVAGLSPGSRIAALADRIRLVVPRPRKLASVRPVPLPSPRHRFYVVGSAIVADSPVSPQAERGQVSVVEYERRDGPARTTHTVRPDDGAIAAMEAFCSAHLAHICAHRGNWTVDIELGAGGPHLAGIGEILDGAWYGGVGPTVIDALSARQKVAFDDGEMALTGWGYTTVPTGDRRGTRPGRALEQAPATLDAVPGEEPADGGDDEPDDFFAGLRE